MKAAVLNTFGAPLAIQTLPDPVLGTGEVIVDVIAAGIAGYAAARFLRRPQLSAGVAGRARAPGGIGRVRATGPDATRLSVGDWVFCDATVRSRDDALDPDMIAARLDLPHRAALPLHRYYHHGSFAEQMLVPTENVTRSATSSRPTQAAGAPSVTLLVPYGGLLGRRSGPARRCW